MTCVWAIPDCVPSPVCSCLVAARLFTDPEPPEPPSVPTPAAADADRVYRPRLL